MSGALTGTSLAFVVPLDLFRNLSLRQTRGCRRPGSRRTQLTS